MWMYILCFIISVLVTQNRKCNYYFRYIVYVAVLSIVSLFFIVLFLIRGRDYENSRLFKPVFKYTGRLIGLNPIVKDAHLLTRDKPCVYVSNHQSILDCASLADVLPYRCTVIAKSSLKYTGPMGLLMYLCKVIFVERSKHKDAIATMRETAAKAVADKVSVFIFPEGTRSDLGEMLPFKKGAFHMAIQCQFPIQPIVVAPYNPFIDHKEKTFDSATYQVQVLPQIDTTGLDGSAVDRLLEETRDKMVAAFESLKTASNGA